MSNDFERALLIKDVCVTQYDSVYFFKIGSLVLTEPLNLTTLAGNRMIWLSGIFYSMPFLAYIYILIVIPSLSCAARNNHRCICCYCISCCDCSSRVYSIG